MTKLTVRAIEAAKPKDTEYKIAAGRGLSICVYPSGIKKWQVRFYINKKQFQATLPLVYGSSGKGYMSLAEARFENERIQALAKQSIDFRDLYKEKKQQEKEKQLVREIENKTFQEMYDNWLDIGVARQNENAEIKRSFEKDVLPSLANKRVSEISDSDIRSILNKIVKDRGANRTAVCIYKDLVQLFKWAEKRQPWRKLLAEGDPTKLVEIEKIISPEYEDIYGCRDRLLSDEEIQQLNSIFHQASIPKQYQLAMWICLSTLCRIGELMLTEWKHVNFEKGEWFIPKENVKSTRGKKRDLLVFLSPYSQKQFQELYELTGSTNWCFPSKNNSVHLYEKSISSYMTDRQAMFYPERSGKRTNDNTLVLANGNNGKWTPHDLRRTGATLMQRLKILPDIIDLCQNHIVHKKKVRRHYQLYDYADEKKEAWAKLGNHLEQILS